MKTKFSISIIVVMAFATIAASPIPKTAPIVPQTSRIMTTQTNSNFGSFRIHRQGKGITSTWSMASESGLTCYVVQRTYLDPSDPYGWEDVNVVPCNSSRSYKWTDENVSAGFISYRIKADMSSGGEIYSDVETIHIISH